ncbi:MAG: RNA 2',3'-cyclic phosphodiesterase [Elusimicrobia bacterium]|nr:RNA 2',3'-cyclic phosphodiesterase [Elusimicrobiota bacterium]
MAWTVTGPAAELVLRAQGALRASGADAKWADGPPFHVTAAFLGETDASRLADLRACAAEAAAEAPPPAEAALEGLGAFPSWEAPKVLWAGVGRGGGDLTAAGRAIIRRLAAHGFPVEDRPFVPHATLGRLRSKRGLAALAAAAERWRAPEAWAGASFACGPVRLIASVLTPNGPIHTELS